MIVSKKTIGFMLISTMSFAVMNSFLKYLNHLPTFELIFFRAITTSIICTIYLKSTGIDIFGQNRKLLVLRALVGTASIICFFYALKLIPIGTAVSLRYLSPIFAAGLAIFFLGEVIRKMQWVFYSVAFLGVVVLKSFDTEVSNIGFIFAIGAAFFSGGVYVIVRKLTTKEEPFVIVNYFMFFATVVGGLVSINNWQTPSTKELYLLLSLGVFGLIGQLFMTKALQSADTSKIAPLKYMEAVFVIIIGIVWFGEIYSWISFFGIALIIAGLTGNLLKKSALDRDT